MSSSQVSGGFWSSILKAWARENGLLEAEKFTVQMFVADTVVLPEKAEDEWAGNYDPETCTWEVVMNPHRDAGGNAAPGWSGGWVGIAADCRLFPGDWCVYEVVREAEEEGEEERGAEEEGGEEDSEDTPPFSHVRLHVFRAFDYDEGVTQEEVEERMRSEDEVVSRGQESSEEEESSDESEYQVDSNKEDEEEEEKKEEKEPSTPPTTRLRGVQEEEEVEEVEAPRPIRRRRMRGAQGRFVKRQRDKEPQRPAVDPHTPAGKQPSAPAVRRSSRVPAKRKMADGREPAGIAPKRRRRTTRKTPAGRLRKAANADAAGPSGAARRTQNEPIEEPAAAEPAQEEPAVPAAPAEETDEAGAASPTPAPSGPLTPGVEGTPAVEEEYNDDYDGWLVAQIVGIKDGHLDKELHQFQVVLHNDAGEQRITWVYRDILESNLCAYRLASVMQHGVLYAGEQEEEHAEEE